MRARSWQRKRPNLIPRTFSSVTFLPPASGSRKEKKQNEKKGTHVMRKTVNKPDLVFHRVLSAVFAFALTATPKIKDGTSRHRQVRNLNWVFSIETRTRACVPLGLPPCMLAARFYLRYRFEAGWGSPDQSAPAETGPPDATGGKIALTSPESPSATRCDHR